MLPARHRNLSNERSPFWRGEWNSDRRHPPRRISLFISFFFFSSSSNRENTIKGDRNLKEKKVFLSFFFIFIIFSLSLSFSLQSFKKFYHTLTELDARLRTLFAERVELVPGPISINFAGEFLCTVFGLFIGSSGILLFVPFLPPLIRDLRPRYEMLEIYPRSNIKTHVYTAERGWIFIPFFSRNEYILLHRRTKKRENRSGELSSCFFANDPRFEVDKWAGKTNGTVIRDRW